MPVIQILDQATINQIAAGEVIERPSAVVKELVENAIDAGASAVTVEIKEGGTSFIRITDNGRGIEKDDIRPAFLRHATSKIRTAEDLLSVSSLGFRGEALSSIAAVAQVELITKMAGEFTGYRYVIEGGEEGSNGDHGLEPIGCPEGATFLVRNLFYNTPARKKFLKTPSSEASYIQDVMEHMAVSHPEVAMKLISNGQTKIQTPGNGNQKDVIYYLYGRDVAAQVTEIAGDYAQMRIQGYIGKPSVTRGNRNLEQYFLNGRFIRNPVISRAIEDAYKPYLMQHRYPFTSLLLQVPPDFIDVNVHPAKLEVRFRNTEALYQLIYHAVSDGLRAKEPIPAVSPGKKERPKKTSPPLTPLPEPFEARRMEAARMEPRVSVEANASTDVLIPKLSRIPKTRIESPVLEGMEETIRQERSACIGNQTDSESIQQKNSLTEQGILQHLQKEEKQQKAKPDIVEEEPAFYAASRKTLPREDSGQESPAQENNLSEQIALPFLSEGARPGHRLIGQLFATYWLFEYEDRFYLLDQHAAHEKVLYERTMKRLASRQMESQNLFPAIVLTLSAREELALKELGEYLKQAGFEIEPFGGREYALSAVPVDLFQLAGADMLTSILDDYLESERLYTPEAVLERVASMSCKAAVKGNQVLTREEAQALMEELMTLEQPYHCPHGRPTMIVMSKYEIEKKFKRVV